MRVISIDSDSPEMPGRLKTIEVYWWYLSYNLMTFRIGFLMNLVHQANMSKNPLYPPVFLSAKMVNDFKWAGFHSEKSLHRKFAIAKQRDAEASEES